MYSQLDIGHILTTIDTLRLRIEERFPGSGLGRVAAELYRVGEQTRPVLDRAARPIWALRIGVGLVSLLIVALAIVMFGFLATLSLDVDGISDVLQAVESAAQDLIFLSLAMYFLFSLEGRVKRNAALGELHRLRSIVHIVDMHQLTKDPEHLLSPHERTEHSPQNRFTRFELARYLDYCTELLSLSSKLAALHVQHVNDPVVLDAVNDVETLASNLSNKIWQKIVVLDTAVNPAART